MHNTITGKYRVYGRLIHRSIQLISRFKVLMRLVQLVSVNKVRVVYVTYLTIVLQMLMHYYNWPEAEQSY